MNSIAKRFSHAATTYDQHAIFQQEIAVRLVERLAWFRIKPRHILDIGSGTGHLTTLLKARFPDAMIVGVDIAETMVHYAQKQHKAKWWEKQKHLFITGDGHALPFQPHQFDLIISNCTLQWCNPLTLFQQAKQALKPEGLFLFTSLGPDTLVELRKSFEAVNNPFHVHPFIDMHNIGDLLAKAGFLDPVMDREELTMLYTNVRQLCDDLKKTGANNLHESRQRGLMGKQCWKQVQAYYAEQFAQAPDQFPATIEVIYGHAFHPQRIPTRVNMAATSLETA